MEPITIPIEDVINLHTFRPKDVPDLLEDYFSACIDKDIFSVPPGQKQLSAYAHWGDVLKLYLDPEALPRIP